MDVGDTKAMIAAVDAAKDGDLTLSRLSDRVSAGKPSQPIDPVWMRNVAQVLERLKDLKWRYVEGPSKRGRAEMGMVNSTGCTSVWGATYPFHPYPFPWTSHLFQDSPSVAMG
jgi:pyruvate-ferredoxin/flavodoxin oxidoreductase